MKYKKGDMVKVRDDLELDNKYGNDEFDCFMLKNKGKVVEILQNNGISYMLTDGTYNYTDEMLLDLTDTDFYEGCIIKNNSRERKTLAVYGQGYLLSGANGFNNAGAWYTKQELIDKGYKIKDFKPKEPINQMTIEEAEKAFNIRIVEGE